ncbi:MFS transporter [Psychrobacter sp.]|uniref:MFS transporter n=1 Tax=Psychrobacter sp. TaxID=56811 RepID=UPI0025E2311C|nr:MFS transporter [Psychrobacter sp.]
MSTIVSSRLPNSPNSKKIVTAAVIGSALEFYDFVLYAFFAVYIGKAFFPSDDPFISLLLSLAVFGIGFITRPLGSIVLGIVADRKGRKIALLLTILFITVGTIGLALTPSYASIGIAAPIIVLTCRLLQGFGLGGEVGPSSAFLIESAPSHKRGLFGSWQLACQGFAAIMAGAFGIILILSLSTEDMFAWGWRIPFFLTLLLIPIALYLRNNMVETLHEHTVASSDNTVHSSANKADSIKTKKSYVPAVVKTGDFWRKIFIAFWAIAGITVPLYISIYMNTYATTTLKLSPAISMSATLVSGIAILMFSVLGGWLSDKFGRKNLMLWPRIVLVLISYPFFNYLVNHIGLSSLMVTTFVLTGFTALSGGACLVTVPELFDRKIRATGLSVAYAGVAVIFGSTTQPVIAWLIQSTGNPVSPAWYMMFIVLLSIVAVWFMEETGNKALK